MTITNYLTIQEVVMGGVLVLGGHMMFDTIPKELKDENISLASRLMGLAICVLPIFSFIYFFSPMHRLEEYYATAINLSAYSLTSSFICISFVRLLGLAKNRWVLISHFAAAILYSVALWTAIAFGSEYIIQQALIVAYTVFCIYALVSAFVCAMLYVVTTKRVTKSADKYLKKEFKWQKVVLTVSINLMCVSLVAPAFHAYPMWLGAIFSLAFVVGVVVLCACFRKMMIYRAIEVFICNHPTEILDDDSEETKEEETTAPLNDEVMQHIEQNINEWLERKGYIERDVSITSVAKIAYTNRTYLSKYINNKYGCSFRAWITSLRIEEAKRMLLCHENLTVGEIALRVGASSQESFTQTFTNYEKLPPSKWRERERSVKNMLEQETTSLPL